MSDLNRVYLSIDIDFWQSKDPAIIGIAETLRIADKKRIPVNVVMNHQQMLPFVNASSARTLINLDQHSDVSDRYVSELNCGTWISYVNWRKSGQYIWARAFDNKNVGNCNGSREWNYDLDWMKFKTKKFNQNSAIKNLFENNCIVDIGICLSPDYTKKNVYDAIKPVIKGRPYKKGRHDESYGRFCKPSNG